MIDLNLDSVEELVCYDKKLRRLLPSMEVLFQTWETSVTLPGMGSVRKRTLADILRSLVEHAGTLSEYLGDDVRVRALDYGIVRNVDFALDRAEEACGAVQGMLDFAVSRDSERVYISSWR